MKLKKNYCAFLLLASSHLYAQKGYWQQEARYQMDVQVDVQTNTMLGKQEIFYTNNSPDTLNKVYYHLYYNAFQPGSEMDMRSQNISDPDRRVGKRISLLKPNEIGYQRIKNLYADADSLDYTITGTILEAKLKKPIKPGGKVKFSLNFESQIPLQIRRTGRNSPEGIAYSMTQWYPKISEYDIDGWHATPYIGREFHGVWGSFDVRIHIDKKYILAGTGILQTGTQDKYPDKTTWHFKADKVHDFAWAADTNYTKESIILTNGVKINFVYHRMAQNAEVWDAFKEKMPQIFALAEQKFGKYPYAEYSFIQGGDGGMEYPMCTLMLGNKNFNSTIHTATHEFMHSWFQGMLATNESLYAWMDEGFTSYAEDVILNEVLQTKEHLPNARSYDGVITLFTKNLAEPLTTHADFFDTNVGYSVSAYSRGSVFLSQLSYIIGKENFEKGMLAYYNTWKFKHPTPRDFRKIMEQVSNMQLDWYFEQYIGTLKKTDYAIDSLRNQNNKTQIYLSRKGNFVMPIDLQVFQADSMYQFYNIPLDVMRGAKTQDDDAVKIQTQKPWFWTNPLYKLEIDTPLSDIIAISIDASDRLLDFDKTNNQLFLNHITLSSNLNGKLAQIQLHKTKGAWEGVYVEIVQKIAKKTSTILYPIPTQENEQDKLDIILPLKSKQIESIKLKTNIGYFNLADHE